MTKAKKILNAAALLLFLVGLPLGSYVYLKMGYEYRKEAIMTQGDFGKMPDLSSLEAVRGELPEEFRGAMTVVGWLDPTKSSGTEMYGRMMDSVYQQFANSPNLYFTTITLADDPVTAAREFAETYHLPDDEMISFLAADEAAFARTAEQFSLPVTAYEAAGEQPLVALVDSSLTIVKHYDLAKREETLSLVELISVIIPLPEKQDIIVERKKEL
ncbi:hypothetical protein [Lewinella sp. W8]|uniref:hypothetical protein n=1 Tax=Lewinella sp. W8 TaxID=2528208 RepID=UPI001068BC37|nr:hypothetical protein [Lewinella sp. W8]MTB53264.1 hypothetical protein [Lewinella sp. W8]